MGESKVGELDALKVVLSEKERAISSLKYKVKKIERLEE